MNIQQRIQKQLDRFQGQGFGKMTARQFEVLEYFENYRNSNGKYPTYRIAAKHLGVDVSVAYRIFNQAIKKTRPVMIGDVLDIIHNSDTDSPMMTARGVVPLSLIHI